MLSPNSSPLSSSNEDTEPRDRLQEISEPLGPYNSTPLDMREEIRLLELTPGEQYDPICCRLLVVICPEDAAYDALSYVWGIKIDESPVINMCAFLGDLDQNDLLLRFLGDDPILTTDFGTVASHVQLGGMIGPLGYAEADLREAFLSTISCPWFSRTWVFQESPRSKSSSDTHGVTISGGFTVP
ncbi:hypothetical protein P154DRAFT_580307 [Amniculicola lignicola CBS 123094]|uniref:Heterokaryon incompatibility domain-containing protein n=1 Tax=Amniculicola lignicola CBS 123094 TaxID=1392246 RepID=A0A6A5W7I9_9PLEO|nr:hypothetical protein P154DRAFT_580307 [Amniculicola lignicola CBS 123094]